MSTIGSSKGACGSFTLKKVGPQTQKVGKHCYRSISKSTISPSHRLLHVFVPCVWAEPRLHHTDVLVEPLCLTSRCTEA